MNKRSLRWMDTQGQNLIRIVVGSYFLATSLGLVSGVQLCVLLPAGMNSALADALSTMILAAVSIAFMTGLWLRLSAICIALLVLSTSVMQNFVLTPQKPDLSHFWQDLALACGVLWSYSGLKQNEIRRAMVTRRGHGTSYVSPKTGPVQPRRVAPSRTAQTERLTKASLAPLLQAQTMQPSCPQPSVPAGAENSAPSPQTVSSSRVKTHKILMPRRNLASGPARPNRGLGSPMSA